MESIEERKTKQKYLKEEVFENPLIDPTKFIEYLETTKPDLDATNVDNWTLSELITMVQEFKFMDFALKSNTITHS
jgi:hypothetical protein